MDYVKFIRGSQSAYDYLKNNNKLNQDTLYFIYDKNNLNSVGKLYLGSVLISDDAEDANFKLNIIPNQLSEGQVLVYKNNGWENCDVRSLDAITSSQETYILNKTEGQTFEQLLATVTAATAGDFAIIKNGNQNFLYVYKNSNWVSIIKELTADTYSIDITNNNISLHNFNKEYYEWNSNNEQYIKKTGFKEGLELKTVENNGFIEVAWYDSPFSNTETLTSILNSKKNNTDFITEVGNISELNHASGNNNSTIIDEINDINNRLVWGDIE